MYVSVKNAALLLHVSEKEVYTWIKQAAIPVHRIHDEYRFNRSELLEWATSRRIRVSPALFEDAADGATRLPSLLEALHSGGIIYGVGGEDMETVLAEVVDALQLPEDIDRDFLYQVMLSRETLGSTGIGDGIAIPHVRNPLVLHVTKPTVTLCFLKNPVDFKAIDDKPVRILFTLICPTVRVHLHLLSRLSYLLHDQGFKAALAREASPADLLAAVQQAEAAIPPSASPEEK